MFGADIFETKTEGGDVVVLVRGFGGKPRLPNRPVDVGNSGTTLRFVTALSGLLDGEITLTGDASIQKRPNTPLLETLNKMGAKAYSIHGDGCAPLVVKGPVRLGAVSIDGGMSSQFISALLLSCPLLDGETILSIDGELKSKPYVDITLEIAEKAGIRITESQNADSKNTDSKTGSKNADSKNAGSKNADSKNTILEKKDAGFSYKISGNQTYNLSDYTIPGDFSSVSYALAAGALIPGAEIAVGNIFPSAQGDSVMIEILKKMGADISWDTKSGVIHVSNKSGCRLKGIAVDAGKTPDLVPVLAVLGAFADGEMRITNAGHVRLKETDRLKAMAEELRKTGVAISETEDGLIIFGSKSKENIKGAALHGRDDHRVVMSLFIAGMMIGDVSIDTADSVKISYPEFFEDMKRVGADFSKEHL